MTNLPQSAFRAWLLVALFLCASQLKANARFTTDREAIDRVIELIDRRLALMPEVAAGKFRQQKPIADPAREHEVIEQSSADAEAIHLDRTAAEAFFSAQIALARAVQTQLFEDWRSRHETPPATRDLATQIRPQLDAIGRGLLTAVYLASTALSDVPAATLHERTTRLLHHPGATQALLDDLARALVAMRITADATWDSVQRVGALRVGTTGDYAPFSDDHGGTLRGIDVHLAEDVAKSWGVTVVFVHTSWPTLMQDLERRRFDLAASGISITPERAQHADFSTPYIFDGKMPIARRENAARYSSLESVDQPGVRVIVNPGGTNERFVREHLNQATIVVHPDNRTIFDEIVAGRADLMITDSIEVRLQSRRHPELQATVAEPFTRVGKAILLPHRSDLTPRVDAWLAPKIAHGEVTEAVADELSRTP
ncbi:MAG: gamma subclass chorismate mutase AroQ [Opitutus sp.]